MEQRHRNRRLYENLPLRLVEDAWDNPEIDIRRFQAIETKLDEIRDHLYANSNAVAGTRGLSAGVSESERPM